MDWSAGILQAPSYPRLGRPCEGRGLHLVGVATRLGTFFWNWPPNFQALICDGLPPRFTGDPPQSRTPQKRNKDANSHVHEREKVRKVRKKGYITATGDKIMSLMSFFSVPKVTVYNEETGVEDVVEVLGSSGVSKRGLSQRGRNCFCLPITL